MSKETTEKCEIQQSNLSKLNYKKKRSKESKEGWWVMSKDGTVGKDIYNMKGEKRIAAGQKGKMKDGRILKDEEGKSLKHVLFRNIIVFSHMPCANAKIKTNKN